ncbi:MAG: class I SAM-dependent methyltransferase [Chlamydiota bacterium]|nr:class I SAM-dependent methyltransferase [Chlamydiota bacterium]
MKKKSDWDPQHYRKHADLQEAIALNFMSPFFFRGDESILDLGCGPGNITKVLATKVKAGQVVGVDISKKMIDYAIAEYGDIPNLHFQLQSADNLHFEKKFDLVTSFFTLHWVKNQKTVLENVRNILVKDGTIRFLIVSGGDPKISEVFQRESWRSEICGMKERFSDVKADEYRLLLEELGFFNISVRVKKIQHTFPTREETIQHYMTWLPSATGLCRERSLELAGEVVDSISDEPNQLTNIETITSVLCVEAQI